MALGTLFLVFIIMAVVSIVGITFLWLTKNSRTKNFCICGLAIWGVVIAFMGATSEPVNYVSQQVIFWVIGIAGVIGILVNYLGKSKTAELIAKILVTVSVVGGIYNLFF